MIKNVDVNNLFLIPDERLEAADEESFKSLGFKVLNSKDSEQEIQRHLEKYPSLNEIRTKDLTWRKLLDTSILLNNFDKVLLIDTDVLITRPCMLPVFDFDICYLREDIPAYRANWKLPWSIPMVPALNAGLVIFKPQQVDFDFLEFITKKYLLKCKDYWWTEQSAWSCLAARLPQRFIFDGHQARVLSGFHGRSALEVKNNKYRYFGNGNKIEDFEDFKHFLDGSSIIHYAGLGKHWFKDSYTFLKTNNSLVIPHQIKANYENTLTLVDKALISSRLFMKELI